MTIAGVIAGMVGIAIFLKLSISDGGKVDASDGAKMILLSMIQIVTLLASFPIQWPPLFTTLFQIGGAVTAFSQHLVNTKCLVPEYSDAEVFYAMRITSALLPVLLVVAVMAVWVLLGYFLKWPADKTDAYVRVSTVSLLYLLWPSLCTQTFSMFACRSICDDTDPENGAIITYLKADLEERCMTGRHAAMIGAVAVPMLLVYVISLPLAAFGIVRRLRAKEHLDSGNSRHSVFSSHGSFTGSLGRAAADVDLDQHKLMSGFAWHRTWGAMYSAYRPGVWGWELSVAARKVCIAMIGVWGFGLGSMQVHLTLLLIFVNTLLTSAVQPFGGEWRQILQRLEIMSLTGTFVALWAGSVFNTYPRCEDQNGVSMLWCEGLSVVAGLAIVGVVLVLVVSYVWIKVSIGKKEKKKRAEEDARKEERALTAARNLASTAAIVSWAAKTRIRKGKKETEIEEKKQKKQVEVEMMPVTSSNIRNASWEENPTRGLNLSTALDVSSGELLGARSTWSGKSSSEAKAVARRKSVKGRRFSAAAANIMSI